MDLTKHDWEKVRDALYDLQADTEENEPHAVSFLRAIQGGSGRTAGINATPCRFITGRHTNRETE